MADACGACNSDKHWAVGLPQMVQKFYSIKSAAHIKRAMIVASVFAVLMTLGGYYTGALTHLNIPNSTSAIAAPTIPHQRIIRKFNITFIKAEIPLSQKSTLTCPVADNAVPTDADIPKQTPPKTNI